MDAQTALMAANALVWLGIAGYIAFLAGRQRLLSQRIDRLEHLHGPEK
ncbi:MAG: CcmD family protein [Desulfovibrio sp.]|nr:CcmD family protein [Desulfovibrio sp.]MCA1986846.1 CcmD family protein [Desulfovibrio sp.]